MDRGNRDRGRHIRPLMFDDRCAQCGEFLVPREFGTGPDTYRLPAGWLSKNLRADHEHETLVHAGCFAPPTASGPDARRSVLGFLRRRR
jgi:hypothetical protein